MYTLSCKDMGMMECDFIASGATQEEAMQASAEHCITVHADKIASMKETMSEDQMKEVMMKAIKSE